MQLYHNLILIVEIPCVSYPFVNWLSFREALQFFVFVFQTNCYLLSYEKDVFVLLLTLFMNNLVIFFNSCIEVLSKIFSNNFSWFLLKQCKIVGIFTVLRSIKISKLNIRQLFTREESISKHLLANLWLWNVSIWAIYWISFFYGEQISLSRICLQNSFIYDVY